MLIAIHELVLGKPKYQNDHEDLHEENERNFDLDPKMHAYSLWSGCDDEFDVHDHDQRTCHDVTSITITAVKTMSRRLGPDIGSGHFGVEDDQRSVRKPGR